MPKNRKPRKLPSTEVKARAPRHNGRAIFFSAEFLRSIEARLVLAIPEAELRSAIALIEATLLNEAVHRGPEALMRALGTSRERIGNLARTRPDTPSRRGAGKLH